ncbi:hypothetical protein TRFO_29768 [Tritrichomonas foetus]|uniref:Cytoplasmic dynein 2 light intermediate chain 1 n=1 Tax=Tritrichomonas foetus TaxID=1144522 RepID=A0A1J4JZJ7_9EUKA|nr:hypothetical protein TRFO_29768 [Tritrichomonas foetus]|eukprot:OHT02956.1 hypothetical protein TRFO_29768 [Tritrichomonas foetus]
MTTKNVDPRRDIWGALIAESDETKMSLGQNDAHFLFIGSTQCGKSTLQNAFFSRLEEPRPTLALSYQSCNVHVQDKDKTLHFWELGGGQKLEKILNTIVTPETQKNFYVFIVLDIMKYKSINEALEWLPIIMRRFKSDIGGAFVVATHYEEFDEKDPSFKAKIINGLQATIHQYGCGLVTFSSKIDSLMTRFKVLVKSLVIPDVKKPERQNSHNAPTLIYPGDDTDSYGNSIDSMQQFTTFVRAELLKETNDREAKGGSEVKIDDPYYADEEIDKTVREQNKLLDDKLKALIASI